MTAPRPDDEGFIKVVTTRRGQVLGASIVGPRAGELLLPWALAISKKLKIAALANPIVPYPTLSEISKRVAGSYYAEKLFSPLVRAFVRLAQRLG